MAEKRGPYLVPDRWVYERLRKLLCLTKPLKILTASNGFALLSECLPAVATVDAGGGFDKAIPFEPIPCSVNQSIDCCLLVIGIATDWSRRHAGADDHLRHVLRPEARSLLAFCGELD